jgi:hypothetical protein
MTARQTKPITLDQRRRRQGQDHALDRYRQRLGKNDEQLRFDPSTDAQLNNATAVLRGLIYLLAIQQNCLLPHLQAKYSRAGKRLFEGENTFHALSAVFWNMLYDPRLTEAYLTVDALDECETGLDQLLAFIIETASTPSSRAKWIVSS